MDSPGFRRREALLPNLYEPGQAHPVDGGFGLPFPRFPRTDSIAAALSHQVPIIDLVGWNTHRPPLPAAGPANPICSLSAMGDSGRNHGSGPVRIPHLHALQALSICVICGRFIFYFAEFNVWYNTEVFYRILIACFKENDKIASLIYL